MRISSTSSSFEFNTRAFEEGLKRATQRLKAMTKKVPSYKPPRFGESRPRPKTEADERARHVDYNHNRRDPFLLELYGTQRWKDFRRHVRKTRVLCEWCKEAGRIVLGAHVHHKVDPRDDLTLAFEESNLVLLCKPCHSRHHVIQSRCQKRDQNRQNA